MSLIVGQGLKRIYEQGTIKVHALRGVDFTIDEGEFSALAGPSGSGKTTLLNLVGCLDSPTEGKVEVAGHDITHLKRAEAADFRLHNIGFVFQAYNLVPVLSAYENAEFSLLLQGRSPKERRDLVMPLLERVGLADMKDRRPHELSGGQQQRVAVVRAIAARPKLVLADEPTANLDSKTAAELLDLMSELNKDSGITFVFSTHDSLVMERARRIIHLRDGNIDHEELHDNAPEA